MTERLTNSGKWGAYLEVSAEELCLGDELTMTAIVFGAPIESFTFNFGWSRNNSWDEGEWETTFARAGARTRQSSYTFTPRKPGRYTLYLDVVDENELQMTIQRYVTVLQPNLMPTAQEGGELPTVPGDDVVVSVRDVSMVFNMASEQFNSLKEYAIALARGELRFKEFRALNHINFDVRRGEAFGLVGTNGSGKSTMLKIIAGVLDASEGSCKVHGTIAPLIELGAGFDMELTAAENIYLNGSLLGYRKEFIDEHFDDIVAFAELEEFMDMPLKNYSSGMVARIAFAVATVTEPDILIVDETLSVGDFLFQRKCERRIQELVESKNVTVLLVSHSIELVERICQRVLWIEKGEQRMLGPVDRVCEAYNSLSN